MGRNLDESLRLLDALIFATLTAHARAPRNRGTADLVAHLAFARRLHLGGNVNTTVLGYHLANMEVAVGWFIARADDDGLGGDPQAPEQPYAAELASVNRFVLLARIARSGLRPPVPPWAPPSH